MKKKLNKEFINLIKELEEKHIQFHLGDETIMERHARVENGEIIIGNYGYRRVITSCCEILLPKTERLK